MFWDSIAKPYDLFETVYNGKVYSNPGILAMMWQRAEWIAPLPSLGRNRKVYKKASALSALTFLLGMIQFWND